MNRPQDTLPELTPSGRLPSLKQHTHNGAASPKLMATDRRTSASPERMGRSSFSSIRENDSDLAQTFTASKVSSYSTEQAIDDSPTAPSRTMAVAVAPQVGAPLTRPNSKLQYQWYPAENFRGWKDIGVRGRIASKSFSDLQCFNMALIKDCEPSEVYEGDTLTRTKNPSAFEKLPLEVYGKCSLACHLIGLRAILTQQTAMIIDNLVLDVPPKNGVEKRNVDLMALLVTSKEIFAKTVETVYRRITIPHSRIFRKFLEQITSKPTHGQWVRRLDFSHLNPALTFLTAQERKETKNLTDETLLRCLDFTPNLQEFLVQEYLDDDLSPEVLQKVFLGLPNLTAADFCGCSSTAFKNAISTSSSWNWPEKLPIRRLSLHKCRTIPTYFLEAILPRLPALTHLDVAGTKLTDKALLSISKKTKLTHLNLAGCRGISAEAVFQFLSSHPAAKELVYLSLATDVRTQDSLATEDVKRILQVLPKTLRSLSLKGSKMDSSIVPFLLPMTKYLEELALGHGLELADIDSLFVPNDDDAAEWKTPTVKYIDLTDMRAHEQLPGIFNNSRLLKRQTAPLEVIEIPSEVADRLKKSPSPLTSRGWRISEANARSWFVRDRLQGQPKDDGARWWKMGARFWGMRKVPVAVAEVGGMYGSFMFGRRL
jgi:hypothetical protein